MWSWFKLLLSLTLLAVAVLFSSCGYTFNHRLSERFNHPKGIYVPIFFNATNEVGAEMAFTNALIRKLLSHQEHIVNSEGESGLILKGTILGLGYSYASTQTPGDKSGLYLYNKIPDQIIVNASIRLALLDTETKKEIWSQTYTPDFQRVNAPRTNLADKNSPSSFGLITQSKIEYSYADLARSFATQAYDGMVEIYYGKK